MTGPSFQVVTKRFGKIIAVLWDLAKTAPEPAHVGGPVPR